MHARITSWARTHLASRSDDGRDGHHDGKRRRRTEKSKPHILLFVFLCLFSLDSVCVCAHNNVFWFLHLLCAAVFNFCVFHSFVHILSHAKANTRQSHAYMILRVCSTLMCYPQFLVFGNCDCGDRRSAAGYSRTNCFNFLRSLICRSFVFNCVFDR